MACLNTARLAVLTDRRIYFDSFIIGNIHDNPELLEGK